MATTPPKDPNYLDAKAAGKVDATLANRIFIQPTPDGWLRMAFGDVYDVDDPRYHSAFIVSPENAKQFAELMYQFAIALLPPQPAAEQDGSGNV